MSSKPVDRQPRVLLQFCVVSVRSRWGVFCFDICRVHAFVLVLLRWACAVYVPRVVLSRSQLKVCCCCCTTCSDHGSLSSHVLLVAMTYIVGISSCGRRVLHCFWQCDCKQARCETVNCACDICHFNRDEDEYKVCWASCDGEKIHIEATSRSETIIKLTGQPMRRSNANSYVTVPLQQPHRVP